MGRWDATKNSLFSFLNKWALGCDFIAASSDITHALIGAVWEQWGEGGRALWEYACPSLAFVCVCRPLYFCLGLTSARMSLQMYEEDVKGKKEACSTRKVHFKVSRVFETMDCPLNAFKKAYGAHPTAGLPGNAAYGHLIEFPKHSLYGLSNHALM